MAWNFCDMGGRSQRVLRALAALVMAGAIACGDAAPEPTASYRAPAGPGVCALDDDASALPRGAPGVEVFANIQAIGSAANAIVHGAGYLWIVESTSNTVSRFNPETGHYDAYFIDVGDGRNPYALALDAERQRAYITNWLTNSLSVADLKSGEILAEVGGALAATDTAIFDAPQGLTLTPEFIYIANTAYRGPGDYAPGSVTVLRRDSLEFVAKIESAHRNTAFVQAVSTASGPGVVVVNSGALEVTNAGAFVRGVSSIEVWREGEDPAQPARQIYALERSDNPRMGAPGRPVLSASGKMIYFPSATAPAVFKFDLAAGQWLRGTVDPILLHKKNAPTADGTFNATLDSRGILYLSALNEDAIYLLDTACDEVLVAAIPVGTTDSQLEGPQDLEIIESAGKTSVYFVTTLSNAMGKIALDFAPR